MIVSIEPGYYEVGMYGIRLENLYIVQNACDGNGTGSSVNKSSLQFEALTLIPFQTKLINVALLSEPQISWLNNYHERVCSQISPLVKSNLALHSWLQDACLPIL
jgi:Xaa-Pro aminopeptidase